VSVTTSESDLPDFGCQAARKNPGGLFHAVTRSCRIISGSGSSGPSRSNMGMGQLRAIHSVIHQCFVAECTYGQTCPGTLKDNHHENDSSVFIEFVTPCACRNN
jgi:hypothetical protein